jgi:phosphatidylglycerophosphatase A
MSHVALIIATVAYVGYVPIAPGTFGSAAGLVLFALMRSTTSFPWGDALAIVTSFGIGTWAAFAAERHFNRKDPGPIVIDEVLGMLITVAWLPASPSVALAGFLWFRVFDVIKPFPARQLESAPGGYGVMLDDAMAGVYAHAALRGTIWLVPQWVS